MGKDEKGAKDTKKSPGEGGAVERQTTSGMVEIVLRDKDGNTVLQKKLANMIVASGRSLLANLLRGESDGALSHIAVGTGTTPPQSEDVILVTEFGDRKAYTVNDLVEAMAAQSILTTGSTDILQISALTSGEKGNMIMVTICESEEEGGDGRFDVKVFVIDEEFKDMDGEVEGEMLEHFKGLSNSIKDEQYFFEVINRDSVLIRVAPLGEGQIPMVSDLRLEGGCDTHIRFSTTFGYDDVNTNIAEAGMFNSEVGGLMYSRVVFSPIPKTNNLTLTLTWKIFF